MQGEANSLINPLHQQWASPRFGPKSGVVTYHLLQPIRLPIAFGRALRAGMPFCRMVPEGILSSFNYFYFLPMRTPLLGLSQDTFSSYPLSNC